MNTEKDLDALLDEILAVCSFEESAEHVRDVAKRMGDDGGQRLWTLYRHRIVAISPVVRMLDYVHAIDSTYIVRDNAVKPSQSEPAPRLTVHTKSTPSPHESYPKMYVSKLCGYPFVTNEDVGNTNTPFYRPEGMTPVELAAFICIELNNYTATEGNIANLVARGVVAEATTPSAGWCSYVEHSGDTRPVGISTYSELVATLSTTTNWYRSVCLSSNCFLAQLDSPGYGLYIFDLSVLEN